MHVWQRTVAVLCAGGGGAAQFDSGWPWVIASSDVTLLHGGATDEGEVTVDPAGLAFLRASIWRDAGASDELAAHEDPRGVLVAGDSRITFDRQSDGSLQLRSEPSPIQRLVDREAPYEVWTSSLGDWGAWISKPTSASTPLHESRSETQFERSIKRMPRGISARSARRFARFVAAQSGTEISGIHSRELWD